KIGFKEKLGFAGLFKMTAAVAGIVLLIGIESFEMNNLKNHWISLVAGFLIAIWIKISNVARKNGFSTLKTNFYYDLMSFVCLIILIIISSNGEELDTLSIYLLKP